MSERLTRKQKWGIATGLVASFGIGFGAGFQTSESGFSSSKAGQIVKGMFDSAAQALDLQDTPEEIARKQEKEEQRQAFIDAGSPGLEEMNIWSDAEVILRHQEIFGALGSTRDVAPIENFQKSIREFNEEFLIENYNNAIVMDFIAEKNIRFTTSFFGHLGENKLTLTEEEHGNRLNLAFSRTIPSRGITSAEGAASLASELLKSAQKQYEQSETNPSIFVEGEYIPSLERGRLAINFTSESDLQNTQQPQPVELAPES